MPNYSRKCLGILHLVALFLIKAEIAKAADTKSLDEYRKFALLREGNIVRGKEIFFTEQKAACSQCHSVNGTAALAGPDLFAIGDKYGRREIIDSILLPSATIAPGYSTTIVETRAREEQGGILRRAADDSVELMQAGGRLARIPTREILSRRTSETSLMPEGLVTGLSLQEFTDLIEFLVSLKQPAHMGTIHHGMPSEIPVAKEAVSFQAFISESNRFQHPVWFGAMPGKENWYLVVEHETGNIWRLDTSPKGEEKTLFAQFGAYQKGTRGLIGMVLHPGFAKNQKFYFAKHTVTDGKFSTVISEGIASNDLKTNSDAPPREVYKWNEVADVHYGGGLAFGPDGFLYIGTGDSGPQEDPHGNAQNMMLPLGKMLRIDVDHSSSGQSYSIPRDNPFRKNPKVLPEIWASGLREPWRFSFDSKTGNLWLGDVGQDRYEEVDIVRPGENYGWNVYEGFERFSNQYRREGSVYVAPVFAYPRKFGVSVTGGFVYRGDRKSAFYGSYIFGDYQSRRLWSLTAKNRSLTSIQQIGVSPEPIVSFGCDRRGEIYVVGYDGMIYHLELPQ